MHRVGSVEKKTMPFFRLDAPSRGDDADLPIGVTLTSVDNPRVNLQRIGGLRMRGIRDVVQVDLVGRMAER